MAQVAGRAGRKSKRGLVVLQTKQPDLPLIHEVVTNDYQRMFGEQIEERNMFRYPPFFRLIYVYLKHRKQRGARPGCRPDGKRLASRLGRTGIGTDLPPVSRIQTLFIKLRTYPAQGHAFKQGNGEPVKTCGHYRACARHSGNSCTSSAPGMACKLLLGGNQSSIAIQHRNEYYFCSPSACALPAFIRCATREERPMRIRTA